MAGLERGAPMPTRIVVHKQSRVLEVEFDDGRNSRLSFEFLRVHSPSAEVRGHGPGQEVLQTGKRDVDLVELEPVGNYAVQPRFSDGHATGIFSWDYLYTLARDHDKMWAGYLERLAAAGASRDAETGAAAPARPAGAASGLSPGPAAGGAGDTIEGARAVTRPRP